MSFKDQGNQQFKEKNFEKAVEFYTQAIEENPEDHTIYGNRSASFYNLKKFDKALEDAEKCVQIKPDWPKGFQRKGLALQAQGKLDEAIEAYSKGLELDENNAAIQQSLSQAIGEKQRSEGGMGGMGGPDGMFGPQAEAKLKQNPRIAKYFEDPLFRTKFEMCGKDPQMMMQLIQSDPRFMDVFKELTGIDLMDVQEKQMKK
jgi:stress-induced-phosphoprotein 1